MTEADERELKRLVETRDSLELILRDLRELNEGLAFLHGVDWRFPPPDAAFRLAIIREDARLLADEIRKASPSPA